MASKSGGAVAEARAHRRRRRNEMEVLYENEIIHYFTVDKIIHLILRTLNLNARAFEFYDRMSILLHQIKIEMAN